MLDDWIVATDDSAWQGADVDYLRVRESGVQAVWHRCGYGVDRPGARPFGFGPDPCLDRHRAAAADAGLRSGVAYVPVPHACGPEESAAAALRHAGGERGALPFRIDVVDLPGIDLVRLLGADVLAAWLTRLGELLAQEWGPGIAFVAPQLGLAADPALLGPFPWAAVADHGTDLDHATLHGPRHRPDRRPPATGPWPAPVIVQHSAANGRVPGYPAGVGISLVDPDAFRAMTAPRPLPVPTGRRDDAATAVGRSGGGADGGAG